MWWLRRSGAANKTLLLPLPGDWLSWLERCLHTAEVTGSNPVSPTLKYLGGRSKASLWLAIDETFPVENVFSGQWDTQPKAEPNQ